MTKNRVKIQTVVKDQLPLFIREEFPLVQEFLSSYYQSQEYQGAPKDLIENIDRYLKIDNLTNLSETTNLSNDISFFDTEIKVNTNSIIGFPERNGLVKINNEIILYSSLAKSDPSLTYPDTLSGCTRGFSGITSYEKNGEIIFTETSAEEHLSGSVVENLNILFLKEFLKKVKKQFVPGFEEKLSNNINQNVFIKQSNDFYTSKGTDQSFEILFRALYGENVDVIKPRDYLLKPSNAGYRISLDLVAEVVEGDPYSLINQTLRQDKIEKYNTPEAYGSISKVEKVYFVDGDYYKISLDADYDKDIIVKGSIFGKFSVHPKTIVTSTTSIGDSFIDVDSTVGFPSSGTIILKKLIDDQVVEETVTYKNKTNTQFLEVSGLTISFEDGSIVTIDSYCYGTSKVDGTEVKLRIRSVLTNPYIDSNTHYFLPNEKIKIKSLGIEGKGFKSNDWIFNIPVKYDSVRLFKNNGQNSYDLITNENHILVVGDFVTVSNNFIGTKNAEVIGIVNDRTFTVSLSNVTLSSNQTYTVKKKISKAISSKYSNINNFTTNVQNTYLNLNEDVLISSSSIPSYYNGSTGQVNIDTFNKSFKIEEKEYTDEYVINLLPFFANDSVVSDHGLYTGDSIYYKGDTLFDNVNAGVYLVKRVNKTQIKLSRSRPDLYNASIQTDPEKENTYYVKLNGNIKNNEIHYRSFYDKQIFPQNILREIKNPINQGDNHTTQPGSIGILMNGVEILNYKSDDAIFYGEIDSINVSSPGFNYDVINPPILTIEDPIGFGATAICSVLGSLKRIDLIDPGFDYISKPTVTITGGNGSGAVAEATLKSIDHVVKFNSNAGVHISTNTIEFNEYHKFRNGERVTYRTYGQKVISGLTTQSDYYVSVIDSKNIRLHSNQNDALSGINTVFLASNGNGIHELKSFNTKNIIAGISVLSEGQGYCNKKRKVNNVNVSLDEIIINGHGYNSREKIIYSFEGTSIGGLSVNKEYIVKVIDSNTFKLCEAGTGNIPEYFYFDNEKYVNITSTGSSGNSYFNYPEIKVTVKGNIGITTLSDQDLSIFEAKIQPIFRGEIESAHVVSSGSKYGSTEIINLTKQPNFVLKSGKEAQLLPIIKDGTIKDVLVLSSGQEYNSPPDIIIEGNGYGAKLTPIVENGQITSIKIINGGHEYKVGDQINVIPSGQGCVLNANITKWTVNLVEKNFKNIKEDDGILEISSNKKEDLQFFHAYAPRKLREVIYSKTGDGQRLEKDLRLNLNKAEISSRYHSPIIGWAYDGNPIYGPYGFSNKNGTGGIKLLKSGYAIKDATNRPEKFIGNEETYPLGFFVEDYQYFGNGDLDEHNGRFCVTPEYPNGVYAYFATIDSKIETDGPFRNYRKPVFPYIIGNTFNSVPNSFNFNPLSNQNSIDLNNTDWFRNTVFLKNNYSYVFNPNNFKNNNSTILSTSLGKLDRVGIFTGGKDYKVNDVIVFDNEGTNGINASAKVERVSGKSVSQISVATTTIDDVQLYPFENNKILALTNEPHNLTNSDLTYISGISTATSDLYGSYFINVPSISYVLNNEIQSPSVTGITTYIYLSGNLNFPNIRENDILTIGEEKVKVLNVDISQSRIRINRNYNGTIGSSHSTSTIVLNNSRIFTFNQDLKTENNFSINKQIYFNPIETVGIGTTTGIGVGTTLFFSNPGVGITQKFVPTRSLYLPNHNLKTGDLLVYSKGDGDPISISTNGSVSSNLVEDQIVYAAKISNDLIGISTVKVYLNSNGNFVGIASTSKSILYFTGIGTGVYHSFKTLNSNVILSTVSKNVVTVSTASSHKLKIGDNVIVSVTPNNVGISTIVIKYDTVSKKILVNPVSFSSGNIDIVNNSIYIENHGFENGDKVVYTSNTPSGGLQNNKIYYVYRYTSNKIKLCNDKYQVFLKNPIFVDITSASSGTISPINPPIKLYKNSSVKFDLSDSSLSYVINNQRYSAFDFNFYFDADFNFKFYSSSSTNSFEVVKFGKVGTSGAYVRFDIKDNTPPILYYNLDPIIIGATTLKLERYIDFEVSNNNVINFVNSKYNGTQTLSGVTTNTFRYNLLEIPEVSSYTPTTASIKYETTSINETGSITKVKVTNKGFNYKTLPGISTILSNNGTEAILEPDGESIGKILSTKIDDIGFNYPTDFTLRPEVNVPQILKMEQLASFEKIKIISSGNNYLVSPRIIVQDGFTKKVVDDVDLRFDFKTNEVKILQNTFGIYNVDPIFIPINNSNGVGIRTMSYNSTTKDVTIYLSVGFSVENSFPFSVGDRVLVENTNIIGNGRGYDSAKYNYQLFTIKDVDENIGGDNGSITYNISEYLNSNENPGIIDNDNKSGRVIAEKDFPIIKATLRVNDYIVGERVETSNGVLGIVENWNPKLQLLTVSSSNDFLVKDRIVGKTTNTQGIIKNKTNFNAYLNLDSGSRVESGWYYDTGKLNDSIQRMHDNYYYQDFSYSLKSKVSYDKWSSDVSSLNHTAGFLKFSDLVVETENINSPINISENAVNTFVDIISEVNVNCIFNFDRVTENSFLVGNQLLSDNIIFSTSELIDYSQSIGNRVLSIDDVSSQFNSNPRTTRYSVVDSFDLGFHYKKYFAFIRDNLLRQERQIIEVSLLQDGTSGFLNQYGKIITSRDLGSFDFKVSGTQGQLLYYPVDYKFNNYDISLISFSLKDTFVGIGTTSLGDSVSIKTYSKEIPIGTPTTVVSIASTQRSSKLLLLVNDISGDQYQSNEVGLVFDGTEVSVLEYGELTNINNNSYSSTGIGNYSFYFNNSTSTIDVDFTPNVGIDTSLIFNAVNVSISNTSFTGIGTQILQTGRINSSSVSIASTTLPTQVVISEYENDSYNSAYYIISIEDTTNNVYKMSELLTITDDDNSYITEYGINQTSDIGIGTLGVGIESGIVKLYYTPEISTDVEIKVFQLALNSLNFNINESNVELINFTNSEIDSGYGYYEGTERSTKKDFELFHNQQKIFERTFYSNNSNDVDLENNVIILPDHFFVTGEELKYIPPSSDYSKSIGIATTSFAGIGNTDLLPEKVYAIKVDSNRIKLARSAQESLLETPISIDFTSLGSVGIGSHKLIGKYQNSRSLILIDNIIQSPIVSTSSTTSLGSSITKFDVKLKFDSPSSFIGGDLIKINDEIMRINTVGFGSTNIVLVERPILGTVAMAHSTGSLIQKSKGNYNIVNNKIFFTEAPYGKVPLGSTENSPDEQDWTGITTNSKFHGRIFNRSGIEDSSNPTYTGNYILDDISDQFTGLTSSFILKSNQQTISGFSTDNAIVLINGILQEPQDQQTLSIKDFNITENSGITTIKFTGSPTTVLSDPNRASVPIGGVIVSVGSTGGFGYQPLVSAGATAIISGVGTISSIGIGTIGSGYRGSSYYDIETVVNNPIGIGSTNLFISNENGIFKKLLFSTSNTISVGDILSASIVSIGDTYVSINVSSASTVGIGTSNKVLVRLSNPTVGIVNIGIETTSNNEIYQNFVGFTTVKNGGISTNVIITNPGSGFTSTNPPTVIIDSPLPYSNIPLIYSLSSPSGIGSQSFIDIVVGQGSSVINFELKNTGYGYNKSEVLTIPTGGLTGIPTSSLTTFKEFKLTIERTFSDEFSGWIPGQIQVLDSFEKFFNGNRKRFQLRLNGNPISIIAKRGSQIDLKYSLLIFINDVLQIPGESYEFNGGSFVTFNEAPKGIVEDFPNSGSKCKVIFYRGTRDIDVVDVDVLKTVKPGDGLTIHANEDVCEDSVTQNERIVTEIESVDSAYTSPYGEDGINDNPNCLRPVTWCRQTEDIVINGQNISKARLLYEPFIHPATHIIQPIGTGTTEIFVESVKTFFDSANEANIQVKQKTIEIVSQDQLIGAAVTVSVSSAGTITNFSINNAGVGYTSSPVVTIASPIGVGTTAIASAIVSDGSITSMTIINPGFGYSSSNPPQVLIEPPKLKYEKNISVSYSGDFGIVVGVATTSVGVASTGIVFDLFIPTNSYIRNSTISGAAATSISGIQTGYYFVVYNSNVGSGFTSLNQDNSILGIGTQYLDNVYRVASSTITQRNISGIGITNINRVIVSVSSLDSFVGLSQTNFYGEYSWGKINLGPRKNPITFPAYTNNGSTGISTGALVRRLNQLKYANYSS